MLKLVEEEGLSDKIKVSSAGMGNWHEGELPDARMRETAEKYGIKLISRGKQLRPSDIRKADYLICMDDSNRQHALRLMKSRSLETNLRMMGEFDPTTDGITEVPDPYSGGMEGFELVYQMLERSMPNLLAKIKEEQNLE